MGLSIKRLLPSYPVPVGLVVGALLIPAHLILPPTLSYTLAAVTLVAIALIYVGFALRDGRRGALIIEIIGASVFCAAALLGLYGFPYVIPIAIMAHAGWDILHHNFPVGARVPSWYIPFCAIVDVVAGGGLLILYAYGAV
ncbi:MAG: hypothetical protein AAGL18_06025 [Pseudomonadota bacterium]